MMHPFISTLFSVAGGIPITLTYSLVPLFFGFISGAVLGLVKVSGPRPARWLVNLYVSVFRGTPLLVQLFIVAYGLPLIGFKISAFLAGILAFSLNSAAYVCEIVRAGIEGIDKGQHEAATALSVPYWRSMQDIILPQAIKRVLPALVSEAINLVKESAIISVLPIGAPDITRQAQFINQQSYSFFEPMLAAACCYYLITSVLNLIGHALEVKLQQGDINRD